MEACQRPELGLPAHNSIDYIAKVETPDDYTIVVTMKTADCNILINSDLGRFLPAHVFANQALSTLKALLYNKAPNVTAGPFKFQAYRAGESTSLVRDPNWIFTATGSPVMLDSYILKVVPDQTVMVEEFLAGTTNLIDNPLLNARSDLRAAADKGSANVYSYPGLSWDYLGFNLADPTHPENGLDSAGRAIDQGKHPLFGDVRVRKAIALAVDVDAIIKGAVFGEGTRMASYLLPTSWGHDRNLKPLPYDPEAAKKLLDVAGWRVGADGVRAKDGVRATFTLITNTGNLRREAIGVIVKDQLAQIGIEVDFQTVDFNVLIDRMYAQTFDAVILGWRNGYPDSPDATQLFTSAGDVVGSGSNFVSYNSPQFSALNAQALTIPGCAQPDRARIYNAMEKMFQEDLPYVPLFAINGMYAASSKVGGFDPAPNELLWNVETWTANSK